MYIVIFNPLKKIQKRGIPIYSTELSLTLAGMGHRVEEVSWPKWMGHLPHFLEVPLLMAFHQFVFPILLILKRPEYCIEPYNSYSLLAAAIFPVVVIYHDFVALRNPRWFLKPSAVYQKILHRLVRCFSGVKLACVSPRVAEEARGYFCNGREISVVPNAIRPLSSTDGGQDMAGELSSFLSDHADRGFVTFCTISGDGANKDFSGLVGALCGLQEDIAMVAFGFSAPGPAMVTCPHPGDGRVVVRSVGPVSGSTMASVIRKADFFLFHSLEEGFGRPVAEALLEERIVISDDVPAVQMLSAEALRNVVVCDIRENFTEGFHRAASRSFIPFERLLTKDHVDSLRELGF